VINSYCNKVEFYGMGYKIKKRGKIADNRTEYMPDQSSVEYSILLVSYVIVLWIIRKMTKSCMTALKNKNKKPYPPKKTITKKQRKALILSALHCNIL
jgi:thiaminase